MENQKSEIQGKLRDSQTRCAHWNSELDIIAIKFKCCNKYFACYSCHNELEDHQPIPWPKADFESEKAIICGVCKHEMNVKSYMNSASKCPNCASKFNHNCKLHWPLYFEAD